MKEVFVSYIRRYVLTFYRTFNLDMGRSVFVSYIRRYVLTVKDIALIHDRPVKVFVSYIRRYVLTRSSRAYSV